MAVASADDLGVQVIGGSSFTAETVNLDNMKLEQKYKIDGYAEIAPLSFEYVDFFSQYKVGKAGDNEEKWHSSDNNAVFTGYRAGYAFENMAWQYSGASAQFAMLKMDITNLGKESTKFIEQATVKVIYNDDYEFGGWVRQYNYDFNNRTVLYDWTEMGAAAIAPEDELEIGVMYTGNYVFGCTLPNAVVEGKEPLRIEINLGDNELTYHIRK